MRRNYQWALGLGVLALCTVGWIAHPGSKAPHASRAAEKAIDQPVVFHVPKTDQPVKLDGELDESVWRDCAYRTGAFFRQDRSTGVPHSEARFLWRDGQLLIALYASDLDIETKHVDGEGAWNDEDAFQLDLRVKDRSYFMRVTPSGKLVDAACGATNGYCDSKHLDFAWQSHTQLGVDLDGTLNQPGDFDEEWVVELAIPLESLGLMGRLGERIDIAISRCDVPGKDTKPCSAWGKAPAAAIVLDAACGHR